MENPVCLTNKDVTEFCQRLKGCEDFMSSMDKSLTKIVDNQEEQKRTFEKYRSDARNDMVIARADWDKRFGINKDDNEKRFSDLETWRASLNGGAKTVMVLFTIINSAIFLGIITYFWNLQGRITDEVIKGLETKYNIDILSND